jgi:hypothetical protein
MSRVTLSRVVIDKGIIRYVGSPPAVSKKDDLIIVNF